MGAMLWMCVLVVLGSAGLLTLSSANLLNICQAQCREEQELKAACSEERRCASLLPDLDAFLSCLEPCSSLGDNCFQRCAFNTDRISAICSRRCPLGGAAGAAGAIPVPADVSSSVVSSRSSAGEEGGALCYKRCYDTLLNAAMNRLYRKRP